MPGPLPSLLEKLFNWEVPWEQEPASPAPGPGPGSPGSPMPGSPMPGPSPAPSGPTKITPVVTNPALSGPPFATYDRVKLTGRLHDDVVRMSGDPSVVDRDGNPWYSFMPGAADVVWMVIQAWPNGGQQGKTKFDPQYNIQPAVPGYTIGAPTKLNVSGDEEIHDMVRVAPAPRMASLLSGGLFSLFSHVPSPLAAAPPVRLLPYKYGLPWERSPLSPALHSDLDGFIKQHNDGKKITSAVVLFAQQLAAGTRKISTGEAVTAQEQDWLTKFAKNCEDVLAGLPKQYPGITFGEYGV